MAEKMKGVLAELKTYTKDGKVVDSKIEFRPTCEWYIEKLRDGYGSTGYQDIGIVIDEFGIDIAEKVIGGEIVEVERDVPEGFRLVSCRPETSFEITRSKIRYPFPDGTKEYLTRRRS